MSDAASTNNHVGHVDGVNLTISLCLTYVLCVSCARVWVRRSNFGRDDVVALIATLVTLGNFISNYVALSAGLGKPDRLLEKESDLDVLDRATLASNITFILALFLAKCAVVLFFTRLTNDPDHRKLHYGNFVLLGLLGSVSMLTLAIDCGPSSVFSWDFKKNADHCPGQYPRWQAITAFDISTEIILLVLPLLMVWKLQMPLKRKAKVVVAFYLRLPVIAFSAARQYYTSRLTSSSTTDISLSASLVVIWQEVELSYSLAAVTLVVMKTFTGDFNTGFGFGDAVQSHGFSNQEAYNMSGFSDRSRDLNKPGTVQVTEYSATKPAGEFSENGKGARAGDAMSRATPIKFRPEQGLQHATVVTSEHNGHHDRSRFGDENGSIRTDKSDAMIIRQHVDYEVKYDLAD